MTSLSPGVLFRTSGLNRTSTPVGPTATPDIIHDTYSKEEHLSGEWPQDSPVSKVYDVRNTSSHMILLNNKSHKYSNRLRGQAIVKAVRPGSEEEYNSRCTTRASSPDPGRHVPKDSEDYSPRINFDRHENCIKSQTPTFSPSRPQSKKGYWWKDHKQFRRTPVSTGYGDPAHTDWHHYSSQVSCFPEWYADTYYTGQNGSRYLGGQRKRTKSLPVSFRDSVKLQHPELSTGQRRYLANTAHVYSVHRMKELVQDRYQTLLYKQKVLESARDRGFFTQEDYQKYLLYINGPRKRQFGIKDPNEHRRPKTAPMSLGSPHSSEGKQDDYEQSQREETIVESPNEDTKTETQKIEKKNRRKSASSETSQRSSESENQSNNRQSENQKHGTSNKNKKSKQKRTPKSTAEIQKEDRGHEEVYDKGHEEVDDSSYTKETGKDDVTVDHENPPESKRLDPPGTNEPTSTSPAVEDDSDYETDRKGTAPEDIEY